MQNSPRKIEVSQIGICHRASSVGWPAWNIIENTGKDGKKRHHVLPFLPTAGSELQWLSGLEVCAALNLNLPESIDFSDYSSSCLMCLASQLASNADRNKPQWHTDTCTGCARSVPVLGRCSFGLRGQALSFLLTGITGLQNRLSALLLCFDSVSKVQSCKLPSFRAHTGWV